jgi:hypothetical protein
MVIHKLCYIWITYQKYMIIIIMELFRCFYSLINVNYNHVFSHISLYFTNYLWDDMLAVHLFNWTDVSVGESVVTVHLSQPIGSVSFFST